MAKAFKLYRTSPFKVTNKDTLFQCYHFESSAEILGFLNIEITNFSFKFHHLERADPRFNLGFYLLYLSRYFGEMS